MNFFKFSKETESTISALNFAINLGLLPNKEVKDCAKCGKKGGLKWTKKPTDADIPFMFVCSEKQCSAAISVSSNTMFDHLTFPLSSALRLIYLWLMKVSVQECANQLELTEDTVIEWFQFFREVCAFTIINYTEAIGGPRHIIDICEYKLETNDDSRGFWIFTGIDRSRGNNFAVHVEDLDCETLWPVMKNYILPGSVVVTPRFKEFVEREKNSVSERLIFVHPQNYPKRHGALDLDSVWIDLKQFLDKEMACDQLSSSELLYVYQYLYFKRDIFCNKPASELILPFLNDVKQVYPGFEKQKTL